MTPVKFHNPISVRVITVLLSILFLLYLTAPVQSIKPDDEIYLTNFNQSYYLANETFVFKLQFLYNVPRRVLRHTIYTSSRDSIQTSLKRAIMESEPGSIVLSEDEHELVSEYLNGDIPDNTIKIDKKKRSLPLVDGDIRIIPITPKATLVSSGAGSGTPSLKRASGGTNLGTSICLHIPFFTTCDNSQDLSTVKNALNSSVEAIWKELDDYKKTNDARLKAMAEALDQQRSILIQLAAEQSNVQSLIGYLLEGVQTNAATIMDGDYQVHSQTNYIKRITNSLLKFSNALASTDPRAVTAQPSLSQLFQGYLSTIQNLTTIGYEVIRDNSNATAFTWKETLLPSQSVSNFTDPPCLNLTGSFKCSSQSNTMTTINPAIGFTAVFSYSCSPSSVTSTGTCSGPDLIVETENHWIYGPFHKNHYGIYSLTVSVQNKGPRTIKIIKPIVQPKNGNTIARNITAGTPAYCANFLGFKLFSSHADPSTTMINSYQPPLPASSDCDSLRLYQAQRDVSSNGVLPTDIYSLYGESEGIVIPFYSNCKLDDLTSALLTINPSYPLISTFNYTCSNGWTQSTSTPLNSACNTVAKSIPDADVKVRHWVTSTCYINLDPSWLELNYYVNPPLITIPNIPRGYQLNQFTINLYGELASSIEFVYTDSWIPVYLITRTSPNKILTDEIELLENDKVVFKMDQNVVIDESNSMFGAGNNGRDCIQQRDQYDYNLLNCFFQNDNPSYIPNIYLSGSITTSGIARFNDKFDFSLSMNSDITFTLTPKKDIDFTYYIQTDANLCPKLMNQITRSSGCSITLFFLDPTKPVVLSPAASGQLPSVIRFNNNSTKTINIGIGTWSVLVGDTAIECFILDCQYTIEFSVVQVTTPNVQIIPEADKLLVAKVYYTSEATLADTVKSMEEIAGQIEDASKQIDSIRSQLDDLEFDMVDLYPYENFTKMRDDVRGLISKINTEPVQSPEENCDGPWNSVKCWFNDFLSVLISIGILMVIIVIVYCVLKKTGACKKIKQKGKEYANYDPEYRAD